MNENTQPPATVGQTILGSVVMLGLMYGLWMGLMWYSNRHVATEAVAAFDIARRNGDRSSACSQAGIAASAYLSAKDEDNYRKWRTVEQQLCGR